MFKKTIIALSLAAIASTAAIGSASAGKWKGHHFKHRHHHGHHYIIKKVYKPYYRGHGCYRYKLKFKRTGKHYWWKKYKACRILYY
jgi:hypothetical protein